ncbi:sodium:proton antiporter [Thioalkalivibrio sp. XN8]|uniref:cation:proton antiporter n=1 Tax=Thioalkalivibrio sp. XN8 TaxID=2712863 RepID=UPI0013EBAAD6|nr:sodium:proton antiporter [Thioalkalivibrio sp. XN8]NGP53909.1 sodium:proton antiporter [Thioalkalivibrio sp. XN8]
MHGATLLLFILLVGLASQWLAWRLKLPSIVILITAGFVLGPVTGVIELAMSTEEVNELIGLGVAIILFEGAMELKLGELRRVGHGIGRLTLAGPPLAWALGAAAAHYVAGLSWPVAWVLGAILVVTGPTVIGPLIRQARLNKESASLLRWEGIANDPVGVLLAVLTYQYLTVAGGEFSETLLSLGTAILAAGLTGGAGGWVVGQLFRRGLVPEHLKPPVLMVLVLAAYSATNFVQHEAGLLSVTIMGVVIGNMQLVEREALRHFKENLSVILLSVLFIVIPAQLELSQLGVLDWRLGLFVAAVLFLVRPLTIGLATIGAPMRREDKLLLAWIAPRGIVAAAAASIFGPSLAASGYPDAERLLPLVFLVIVVTALAHGLSLGPVTRKLKLSAKRANGLLIVGATPWTHALALALKKLEISVLVADGAWSHLKPLRMDDIRTYYGEILSEHAEEELDLQHLSYLLAATGNDFYNALVCKARGGTFGRHRTFQLATHQESRQESKRMALQQRGHTAFDDGEDFNTLHERLDRGWTMQTTRLTETYRLDDMRERLGEQGEDWVLIGGVNGDGLFQLFSEEQPFKPESGWRLLYFAPEARDDAG